MKREFPLICIAVVLLILTSEAQIKSPFNKGVNVTGWFQSSDTRQIQFSKFTKRDFKEIRSLGCDVIRLPINMHELTDGAPDYIVDPLLFSFLDQVVDWSEELGISLILDNHTFDPNESTDPNIDSTLTKVWRQIARHYEPRSTLIYYEVLNEPHGISAALWGGIQQSVIHAIRAVDNKHTIIVGGVNFNNYEELSTLPVYTDDNLIYTFHFYDPFVFTHQGAGWTQPSMETVAGVPFPYEAATMPPVPNEIRGSWIESAMNNYRTEGNVARVRQLIDIAATFAVQRNVRVFCGEFGVFDVNSDDTQRTAWYTEVRSYLEQKQIAWTIWDYRGPFGIFNKNSNEVFDHDVNIPLVQGLSLTPPPQQPWQNVFQQTDLLIYNDYLAPGIIDNSFAAKGTLDYYYSDDVHSGNYSIAWQNVQQYASMTLDFKPNVNLALLPSGDFKADFWIKGNTPGTQFDLRFVDTKRNANDRPWRRGITINDGLVPFDNAWHHMQIPLTMFEDKGAYDNGWVPPPGDFNWAEVDKVELSAEVAFSAGARLLIDDFKISGEPVAITDITRVEEPLLMIYPNPSHEHLYIEYTSTSPGQVEIELSNALGQITHRSSHASDTGVFSWSVDVSSLAKGLYVLRLCKGEHYISRKVLLQNR